MSTRHTMDSKPVSVKALRDAFDIVDSRIKASTFTENIKNYLRLCFNNFVFGRNQDMFGYLQEADMTFGTFCGKLRGVQEKAFTRQGKEDEEMKQELATFLETTVGDAITAARSAMRPIQRGR